MHFDLARIGAGLPVLGAVDELASALGATADGGVGLAVVQAPPGTGKTTLVPPLVANLVDAAGGGRVVVTQPRRIAARAGARRLAHLSGERLGGAVGFTVRGESRAGDDTAVEFVTTGVLVRRLLADPELAGVGAVVLDEVHERHLDSDLCFAMLRELRELRPDLGLVVMSATLDASRWATLLGEDDAPAPVVAVEADLYPLDVRWAPAPPGVQRLDHRGVTPAFLDHVVATTASAFSTGEGNALVFLPGAREVSRVADGLRGRGLEVDELTGRLDGRAQDAVLREGGERRVIVATAVAESSLTVPGVRLVVDAGLAREPRYDSGRQMGGLVTVSEARSSAQQRAGRAARLGPGVVVRCLAESDWPRLRDFTTPEVLTADLTQATLDLACWGSPGGDGLRLPDALPATTLAAAARTLQGLGALDDDGRATGEGRAMAAVPADPRLARALVVAAPLVGARSAAEAVALLTGDERAPGGDLVALLREVRRGRGPSASRWRTEADRLERIVTAGVASTGSATHPVLEPVERTSPSAVGPATGSPSEVLGLVTALAHPDRVARRRGGPESTAYLLAGGTGVVLERGSQLAGSEWLAVAEMGRAHTQDGTGAVVRAAVPITREVAEQAAAHLRRHEVRATWDDGRVTAREVDALGAIELVATPVAAPPEAARAAVVEALRRQGLGLDAPGLFTWYEPAHQLRNRLALLHHELGEPWPDVSSEALVESADLWLGADLDRLARGTSAARIDLVAALRNLLPWPAATRLDELAPQRLEVPTGSHVALAYPDDPSDRVVLAVKLQELFGLVDTPRLVDGRVPVLLHLLSPARRPLAVTDDLRSFWANAYPAVRAENRGRYPKHPWPEDPLTAPPRRGTTRSGV